MSNQLQTNLDAILQDKNTNLLPENLKAGITCLGVEGTMKEGIDTSDATATSEDITINKTAYVNGEKITGTLPLFPNTRTFTAEGGVTNDAENSKLRLTTINTLKQTLDSNLNMEFNAEYSDIATAIGLTADKIVQGNTILGIEGTYQGSETQQNIPNIFMQETEPTIKDGIWVQSDNTYENTIITNNISSEPQLSDKYDKSILPNDVTNTNTRMFKYNGNIYIAQNNFLGLLNTSDMTITKIYDSLPFSISKEGEYSQIYYTNILVCNNQIFIGKISSGEILKYNLEENTIENFVTLPNSAQYFNLFYYNNYIYAITTYNSPSFYKIHFENKSITALEYPDGQDNYLKRSCIVLAGDKMYIFASVGNKKAFCFDLKTETYSNLPDVEGISRMYDGTVLYYNGICYILDASGSGLYNTILTYDIETQTYGNIDVTNYPYSMGIFDENIAYLYGGSESVKMIIPFLNFPVNSIIIDNSLDTYATKLVEYDDANITGDIKTSFNDVIYNDLSGNIIQTLPTYYGDGTQWIKFKN